MRKLSAFFVALCVVPFVGTSKLGSAPALAQTTRADLEQVRLQRSQHQAALQRLQEDAKQALQQKPLSVLDKKQGLPGVDPHAYVSYAPYFWPNPNKPDGLPYIRKDGSRNVELVARGDSGNAGTVRRAVCTLLLADFFTPNRAYVRHAATLVRTWFIAPKTRMLPHLDYGQAIPGGVTGRKEGIVEWKDIPLFLFCIEHLEKSPEWKEKDKKALRAWFSDYYTWLNTSKLGIQEKKAGNNHGTWWDVQAVAIALYLGKKEEAYKIVEEAKTKRIAEQIEPDGSMPRELARADSWGYSTFNLTALCALASYATSLGVDLWNYQTPDGRSIRAAMNYLLPFAEGDKPWAHSLKEGQTIEVNRLVVPLLRAALGWKEVALREKAKKFAGEMWETTRDRLLIEGAF